ncbi:hemocyanin C chain [Trichonephila clavipes]|nr:hemocyanin C chain [Trichonephila clavipes]
MAIFVLDAMPANAAFQSALSNDIVALSPELWFGVRFRFIDNPICYKLRVFSITTGAETFDEFIDLCHQARDFVNEALYVYAVSVAILHRTDCRGVSLPPVQEVFPDKFFPVETIYKAFKVASHHPDKDDEIIVDVEATGNILDPEYNLAYYREDVGINAHHWHWHLVYPSTWNSAVTGKVKDRKGELFYFMHQQMCAR